MFEILLAVLSICAAVGLLLIGKAGPKGEVKPFLRTEPRQLGYTFAIMVLAILAVVFTVDAAGTLLSPKA